MGVVVFESDAAWPAELGARLSGRQSACVLVQQPDEPWDALYARLLKRIGQLQQPLEELVWVVGTAGSARDVFWAVRVMEHLAQVGLSADCRLHLVSSGGAATSERELDSGVNSRPDGGRDLAVSA